MPALTGSFFLDGVAVLAVAAFVAVVVIWPRIAGRSLRSVATRVVLLATVNLLVLLTAATQLNSAYLFFASWADLRGALTGQVAQSHLDRGGSATQAAGRQVTGQHAVSPASVRALPARLARAGVGAFTVHGAQSGLTGRVLVHLPAGYQSAANTSRRYPVLEAFHGYPSTPANWVKIFHLDQVVQKQVNAHKMRPTLLVMPQVEIPPGVDTEGVNGTSGRPQLETWLTQDVPNWVASTFRVDTNRSSWATIGYSAGGWNAAMATILHPAQYGAGIVLGGYFKPEFGPFYQPYPPGDPLARRYDLPREVRHNHPPVSLWVETSHADPASYASTAAFLRSTRSPTAVHAVVLQNAGHRDSVWIALLPEALRWLGANVAGFHP